VIIDFRETKTKMEIEREGRERYIVPKKNTHKQKDI
jgi:hypothetical protein